MALTTSKTSGLNVMPKNRISQSFFNQVPDSDDLVLDAKNFARIGQPVSVIGRFLNHPSNMPAATLALSLGSLDFCSPTSKKVGVFRFFRIYVNF